jgi:hypothetical protein
MSLMQSHNGRSRWFSFRLRCVKAKLAFRPDELIEPQTNEQNSKHSSDATLYIDPSLNIFDNQDIQGTTRVVTNGSGTVVARHDYLPFGEEVGSNIGLSRKPANKKHQKKALTFCEGELIVRPLAVFLTRDRLQVPEARANSHGRVLSDPVKVCLPELIERRLNPGPRGSFARRYFEGRILRSLGDK